MKSTILTKQFQNLFENCRNRIKIDVPNTHIPDCPPTWLGTGTSIKSDRLC